MRKKYPHLFLVLPSLFWANSTAFATGNFAGSYLSIGSNIGAVTNSKGLQRVRNRGIEISLARLGDSETFPWQGIFFDWSEGNGFGSGLELGFGVIGVDAAFTERAGFRHRFLLASPILSLYAGRDQNGQQFGALFKIPIPFF